MSPERLLGWGWWLAVALCCAWALGGWVRRRVKYGGGRVSEGEPRCARCGYIIRSGASAICSECGTDVRRGGLLTPSTLKPPGVMPWLGLVALAAVPAAEWAGPTVAEWQPIGWEFNVAQRVDLPDVPGKVRWAQPSAIVYAAGHGRYGRRETHDVQVHMYVGYGQADPRLFVNARNMKCQLSYGSDSRRLEAPFGEWAVSTLVHAAGYDPNSAAGASAARDIGRAVTRLAAGDFSSSGDGKIAVPLARQSVSYRQPMRVKWTVNAVTGLVLFVVAAVPIVLWRRRRKARAAAAHEALLERLALMPPAHAA